MCTHTSRVRVLSPWYIKVSALKKEVHSILGPSVLETCNQTGGHSKKDNIVKGLEERISETKRSLLRSNGMKLRKEKCRVNITNKFPVLKPTGIRLFQDKW